MTVYNIGLMAVLYLPVLVDSILLFVWIWQKENLNPASINRPTVSILVAVRNEEDHIRKCINSLLALKYPDHLLEILIGDDSSEDKTHAIALGFATEKAHLKVFSISEQLSGQKGKANVLAQLAQKANGEYLFFTDADIVVPPNWIEEMLAGFTPKVGLVAGVTGVYGKTVWALCQFVDWIFALGMVKVANDLGYTATALGNNMAVSRKAYDAVGGYERIPFSVTEDFELLKQIKKKGYKGNQRYHQGVLAWSAPEPNWKRLLHQRKRWMKGAFQLPWIIVGILAIQALFFPALLLVLWADPMVGLLTLSVKILCQSAFIYYAMSKIGHKGNLFLLIFYECYSIMLSMTLLFFYVLPLKLNWKGRKY